MQSPGFDMVLFLRTNNSLTLVLLHLQGLGELGPRGMMHIEEVYPSLGEVL